MNSYMDLSSKEKFGRSVNRVREYCLRNRLSLRQLLRGEGCYVDDNKLKSLLPIKLYQLIKNCFIGYALFDEKKGYHRFRLLDILGGVPALVVVIPSYNNRKWVLKNLESVFSQRYSNYRIIYIDDCSSDGTLDQVNNLTEMKGMWGRLTLFSQPERCYASGSRYSAYHLCDGDEIICMLDGDDWLSNPYSLSNIAELYKNGALSTYGSYMLYGDSNKIPIILGNEVFPKKVLNSRNFRNYRWTSCHMRTGYAYLFQQIRLSDLLDSKNRFLHSCTDLAEMYPVLEQASPHISLCKEVTYIYNKAASLQNSTSYFHLGNNIVESVYREYIGEKLRSINKYPRVSWDLIFKMRGTSYVEEDFVVHGEIPNIKKMLELMWVTKCHYLGKGLELVNSFNLFSRNISVGRLVSLNENYIERKVGGLDLCVSVENWEVVRWL